MILMAFIVCEFLGNYISFSDSHFFQKEKQIEKISIYTQTIAGIEN